MRVARGFPFRIVMLVCLRAALDLATSAWAARLDFCVAKAHRPNGTCLALSTSPARQAIQHTTLREGRLTKGVPGLARP